MKYVLICMSNGDSYRVTSPRDIERVERVLSASLSHRPSVINVQTKAGAVAVFVDKISSVVRGGDD